MSSHMAKNGVVSHADRITVANVFVAVALSLCSMATGLLPLNFADRWRSSTRYQSLKLTFGSLLLGFSGGVLLFTIMVHLQTDVRQSVHSLQAAGRLPTSPEHLGELILCAGFFAAFAVNELLIRARGTDTANAWPSPQSFRGLLGVASLSVHEAFVGLCVGWQPVGHADGVWHTFVGLAANKLIVAFCIGLELVWSGARKPAVVACTAAFASVTPVGVAVGMALTRSPGCVAVVMEAIAVGTLVYVLFFEVLPKLKRSGLVHLLSMVIGFGVMMMFQINTHHEPSCSSVVKDIQE